MGVSLDYCTTESVSQIVADSIKTEAAHLSPNHGWWAESLNFFDAGKGNGRLYGGTKIYLISFSNVNVDIDDDSLMAYRDTCYILEKLAEWSQKYSLTWQVECAGEAIGNVVAGQWDTQLQEYVESMKKMFPWPASFEDKVKGDFGQVRLPVVVATV